MISPWRTTAAKNLLQRSSRTLATSTTARLIPTVAPSSRRRALSSSQPRLEATTAPLTSGTAKRTPVAPTELLTVLEETIKTHGPLPVSRYMTLCLAHPTLGYYTTRTVFGAGGDFVTSPEISQIFGELLAIWYVTQWIAQGRSSRVRIVELGPGRGTLLADILRTFKALPAHSSPPVTSIHLVESSEQLREEQKKKLEAAGFGDVTTEWWGNVEEVPTTDDEFTVIVAHEFFDALPIHIFENTPNGWREVLVDIADPNAVIVSSTPKQPLRLVLAPAPTPASTLYTRLASLAETPAPSASSSLSFDTTLPPSPPTATSSPTFTPNAPPPPVAHSRASSLSPTLTRFSRLPVGSRMEISPASWEIARGVGKLLAGEKGGAGLVVDYGDAKAFGRSWRGFRKHQVVDPLSEPGRTDLTANVDFSYLSEALGDLAVSHGPLPQSTFLHSLGLMPRLERLLRGATSDERRKEIESAAKRLVDGLGMGKQYQVMGITPKGDVPGVKEGECFPFVKEVVEAEKEREKAAKTVKA